MGLRAGKARDWVRKVAVVIDSRRLGVARSRRLY